MYSPALHPGHGVEDDINERWGHLATSGREKGQLAGGFKLGSSRAAEAAAAECRHHDVVPKEGQRAHVQLTLS